MVSLRLPFKLHEKEYLVELVLVSVIFTMIIPIVEVLNPQISYSQTTSFQCNPNTGINISKSNCFSMDFNNAQNTTAGSGNQTAMP